MKKTTKGALAAGAAAALLLGGAGSLAYWNATASVDGGTLSSGKLTLSDTTVGTCAAAEWQIDSVLTPNPDFDPATDTLVPGDTLTKTCTFSVGAEGLHLKATVAVTGGASTATWFTTTGTAFHNDTTGADLTSASVITEANDGDDITATIKVNVPYGSGVDNTTQEQTGAVLSDLGVTLTQVHS